MTLQVVFNISDGSSVRQQPTVSLFQETNPSHRRSYRGLQSASLKQTAHLHLRATLDDARVSPTGRVVRHNIGHTIGVVDAPHVVGPELIGISASMLNRA